MKSKLTVKSETSKNGFDYERRKRGSDMKYWFLNEYLKKMKKNYFLEVNEEIR